MGIITTAITATTIKETTTNQTKKGFSLFSSSIFYLCLLSSVLLLFAQCGSSPKIQSDATPVSHEIWDNLLQKHVKKTGLVDYKGFIADSTLLNQYLALLQKNHPNDQHWSPIEQQCYWMNAYNAFTIALIIRNYPVASIKDIGKGLNIPFVSSPWDIKFVQIERQTYDLNNIEHNILRKHFDDPRIHFGINCASISCPNLAPEAFVAHKMDQQLDSLAVTFINNPSKNKISANQAEISKIFSWFKGDFTKKGSLISFLNKYSKTTINNKATISHLDYDWNLNETK